MPRHPSEYADLLIKKIAEHNASCWLINTGWIAGGYGESSRIRIKWTRALLNAALSGALDDVVRLDQAEELQAGAVVEAHAAARPLRRRSRTLCPSTGPP